MALTQMMDKCAPIRAYNGKKQIVSFETPNNMF